MAANLAKWPSNQGLISKIRPSDGCKGIQFRWRWDRGTISTQLDVIWGMSDYYSSITKIALQIVGDGDDLLSVDLNRTEIVTSRV